MTAFAGIVTFAGASDHIQADEQIVRALVSRTTARARARRLDGALFAQRTAVSPGDEQREPLPISGNDGCSLFVADARIDNREELASALAISLSELARTSDSALILRMFERWGEAGVARCLGAFAFAHWDAKGRRLILGRDCLGNRALFFHRGDGFVAFATTLGAMLAMPWVPRQIDEAALAGFMVANLTEARSTFYRGIERVPSRTLVTIGHNAISHRYYWSPNVDATPPYRRDEDYIERARELFDQAVLACTADTPHVAITTSGGFDSSAIAATVARLGRAESIACYTIVPLAGTQIDQGPHKYLDERDKVQALARMYPALKIQFFAPDKRHRYEEDVTRFFARTQMPTLGPVLLGGQGHMHDAIAAAGHRAMLVGTAGNFGLTWNGRFSLLALAGSGEWWNFARELHALHRQSGRSLARTFASEAVMPAAPAGLRRFINRLRGRDPGSVSRYSALKPDYIAEHGLRASWLEQGLDPWAGVAGRDAVRFRARILYDHNQIGRDFGGRALNGWVMTLAIPTVIAGSWSSCWPYPSRCIAATAFPVRLLARS